MDKDLTADKQALKKTRVRRFFLEAAKEMIHREGVEAVSVRKVADRASYAYATLYNNFTVLNELLWETKKDMINDVIANMHSELQDVTMDKGGIKKTFATYATYYLDNPNVFRFFYFYKVNETKDSMDSLSEPDFDMMMKKSFEHLVTCGKLGEDDVEITGKLLIYTVHALLTMFFSGNGSITEDSVMKELDQVIEFLL